MIPTLRLEVVRGRIETRNNFQQTTFLACLAEQHEKWGKKAQNKRSQSSGWEKNYGSGAERAAGVGVQVNGRGPRTLCYSTIDNAARGDKCFQTFGYLLKKKQNRNLLRKFEKTGRYWKLLKWRLKQCLRMWFCLYWYNYHACFWVMDNGPVYAETGISENGIVNEHMLISTLLSYKACVFIKKAHLWKKLAKVGKLEMPGFLVSCSHL